MCRRKRKENIGPVRQNATRISLQALIGVPATFADPQQYATCHVHIKGGRRGGAFRSRRIEVVTGREPNGGFKATICSAARSNRWQQTYTL